MLSKNGFGYLKINIEKFCNVAQRSPLLLITDLDKAQCAAALISKWMGARTHPDKLVFRVAVREIEAWLLADHLGMKKLLVAGATDLPKDPDLLLDPKQFLLRCASRAPRAVQNDLLVETGAIAPQGLGYNQRMGDFVRNIWDPKRAQHCALTAYVGHLVGCGKWRKSFNFLHKNPKLSGVARNNFQPDTLLPMP